MNARQQDHRKHSYRHATHISARGRFPEFAPSIDTDPPADWNESSSFKSIVTT